MFEQHSLSISGYLAGPHDAGSYNSSPEDTGFFCSWGGKWETAYGR